MLTSISNYVEKYTKILSTVTNINIEVADVNLVRIAGTGIYSDGVGQSIKVPGNVYQHVISNKRTIIIDNPKEHEICLSCSHLDKCMETLEICTPIIFNNNVIGVIGIICFTKIEKERILQQIDLYKDFIQQIADAIALAVNEEQNTRQIQNILDTFLEITDANNRGIITLNNSNMITYMNDKAKEYLNDSRGTVLLRKTGDTIAGMEEFELELNGNIVSIVGNITKLNSSDESFAYTLTFDLLANYITTVSHNVSNKSGTGLSAIIGESKSIVELKQQVLRIAETTSTILITGESGTGKEVFARSIHETSSRSNGPFIAINCGAIPDALLESELFGYVAGAFTGARSTGHIGKFEMADQGVLFLDEIGAMPLYLQVKLLRVLQERCITRLGSNRVIPINVRIIAATNDDLSELIHQRLFREDLYYRLNVIPFKIPPLRERTDDIPLLANYFLEKYCNLFGKNTVRPTPRLIKALQQYTWPGNVREFENVIEYIVNIIPNGGSATVNMLPSKITNIIDEKKYISSANSIIPICELEKNMIIKAINMYGNTTEGKKAAADALGIGIATMYRKLKDYGLMKN